MRPRRRWTAKGMPCQLGLGLRAQPPLDPGQGEVAVEGRPAACRLGHDGRGGPVHRAPPARRARGRAAAAPAPGRTRRWPARGGTRRARQRASAGPQGVAQRPELLLGHLAQEAQRDVPAGRARPAAGSSRARARARPGAGASPRRARRPRTCAPAGASSVRRRRRAARGRSRSPRAARPRSARAPGGP